MLWVRVSRSVRVKVSRSVRVRVRVRVSPSSNAACTACCSGPSTGGGEGYRVRLRRRLRPKLRVKPNLTLSLTLSPTWPEHRKTSPNSTSLSARWSVPSEKVSVVPVLVAGVGGNVMRQVELPSTTAESDSPEKSSEILAPGVPKPHTTAD